eukprot:gene12464-6214_t
MQNVESLKRLLSFFPITKIIQKQENKETDLENVEIIKNEGEFYFEKFSVKLFKDFFSLEKFFTLFTDEYLSNIYIEKITVSFHELSIDLENRSEFEKMILKGIKLRLMECHESTLFYSLKHCKVDNIDKFVQKQKIVHEKFISRYTNRYYDRYDSKCDFQISYRLKNNEMVLLEHFKGEYISKQIVEFSSLDDVFERFGIKKSKICGSIKKENDGYIHSNIIIYESITSLKFKKISLNCNVRLVIGNLKLILKQAEISKFANYFTFEIDELEVGNSLIKMKESKSRINTINRIDYQNLKISDFYLSTKVEMLKKFPSIIQQFPCKILSNSVLNDDLTIKSSTTDLIEIKIPFGKIIVKSQGYEYHDFKFELNDHEVGFKFDNLDNGDLKSSSLDIKDNCLRAMSVVDNLGFKNDSFKKYIFQFEIEKVSFKDTGFLEYKGKFQSNDLIFRIPLHTRNVPELFVNNLFNSFFEKITILSLNLKSNLKKLQDITFHFEY